MINRKFVLKRNKGGHFCPLSDAIYPLPDATSPIFGHFGAYLCWFALFRFLSFQKNTVIIGLKVYLVVTQKNLGKYF